MKVFVTGATGAIGRYAVPALLGDGHTVTALARTGAKAEALREQGASAALVSLFDRDRLADALAGHDAVVNLATAIPPASRYLFERAWRENDRIRTAGSAAVVEAARACGIRRIVQESVAFLYADRGGEWIDEDVPVEPFPRAASNLAAEENARGRDEAVVLRFGLFYGPTSSHSKQFLAAARLRVGTAPGPPESYTSSIHLADAGAAVSAALQAPPGIYNVVDDEPLTSHEYADAICAAIGRKALLYAPGRLTRLYGARTAAITRSQRVSNRRFRSAAGWAPRYPSAKDGWAATVAAR